MLGDGSDCGYGLFYCAQQFRLSKHLDHDGWTHHDGSIYKTRSPSPAEAAEPAAGAILSILKEAGDDVSPPGSPPSTPELAPDADWRLAARCGRFAQL